ncbi:MAG: GntR family transcriptional regulator [Granulosicoccus sp.]|jgi:GntR family transcriptional regulator
MALNADSPIPLYRQLADKIRMDIEGGFYAVAERIPSEHEFARCYGIGRPTVRQATDSLVQQGLLKRRRGSGTYVISPARSIDLFSLAGTSAALQKSGFDSRLKLIKGPVREHKSSAGSNSSPTDDSKVCEECLRIERRATVDGTPVLYETLWFDADLFAGLEKRSLANQSLSTLVREVFFLEPSSADQKFSVISADERQAKQLEIPMGTPLLRVYRELHFDVQRSALHAEIICVTSNFDFSQTLYPARAVSSETAGRTATDLEHLQL